MYKKIDNDIPLTLLRADIVCCCGEIKHCIMFVSADNNQVENHITA